MYLFLGIKNSLKVNLYGKWQSHMQLSVAAIMSKILIVCVKCWPYNTEKIVKVYPPLISEKTPTTKHRTASYFSYRCIWDTFQDSRKIKKTLHCYSLFEINPQKQSRTLSKHLTAISSTKQFKFADWKNMLTQTFYKLDECFYTPFLFKHNSF